MLIPEEEKVACKQIDVSYLIENWGPSLNFYCKNGKGNIPNPLNKCLIHINFQTNVVSLNVKQWLPSLGTQGTSREIVVFRQKK